VVGWVGIVAVGIVAVGALVLLIRSGGPGASVAAAGGKPQEAIAVADQPEQPQTLATHPPTIPQTKQNKRNQPIQPTSTAGYIGYGEGGKLTEAVSAAMMSSNNRAASSYLALAPAPALAI